jgi:hypothetical protein
MSEEGNKPIVSVEIGAKVSAEIKAEVPRESVGRTLDALVDIIRPFTEARGLKADNIRLQRAEIAYKIAKLARDAAEAEHLELKPPPTKFMVPFLERASLEDKDEELHSRWAALLLAASTHFEARQLTFIDIMSRVSSEELSLLEEICLSQKTFPETYHPDGHMIENKQNAEELSRTFRKIQPPLRPDVIRQIFDRYLEEHPFHYGRVMHANVYNEGSYLMQYTEYGIASAPKYQSLEILEHEKLVTFNSVEPPGTVVKTGYFDVTFLGVGFIRDCSPKAREAVRKHDEEFRNRVAPIRR